jgi:hypothetical protein
MHSQLEPRVVQLPSEIDRCLLPGLPVELIRACYAAAPGNEIESGKFASSESSAALVANAFGFFLDRACARLAGIFSQGPALLQAAGIPKPPGAGQ